MNLPLSILGAPTSSAPSADADLWAALRNRVRGEVRFDRLARAMYATDASIYEIPPLGVVTPRDIEDVIAAVGECRRFGVSVVPRGAGTGLAGGAVGPGVQMDMSRHMQRILRVDAASRTVEVEPGVVLDELNVHLRPLGLHFAPDVATSSRATIGGMIANNSCGAHSAVFGRTVDHVLELSVILSNGECVTFAKGDGNSGPRSALPSTPAGAAQRIAAGLGRIRDENHEEIVRRFPKVMRSNGGYGLDRLGPPGTPADATTILCGSEGTLGIVVRAKLNLIPIPSRTGLIVLHFDSLRKGLEATPAILTHRPAAVELVDRLIVSAAGENASMQRRSAFLTGSPEALLVVEFFANDEAELQARVRKFLGDRDAVGSAYATPVVTDAPGQADVWNVRTSGLGLLMSKPGDAQPYAFVEDSAVDPSRLAAYIDRFKAVLDAEGIHAGYYAHASVGCIHVKPVLNLKHGADIERMRRIADAVSDLALEFGGAMTGEHGDGIVRSCWLEKTYGPKLMSAFRQVKTLFDPAGIMNPHKIVDPWPMTEHLRYGASFRSSEVKTYLDFSAYGGMPGLAGMCSGVGQCRQRLVGTMCPSYMATGDETHTTRARANALRLALSNRGMLEGLADPALEEVMDLCLSCKACKTECPTGVDMARLKAEYLARRHLVHGASKRARLLASLPLMLAKASRFPRIVSAVARSAPMRRAMEWMFRLDRRIAMPPLARQTFRAWWRRRPSPTHKTPLLGPAALFVDTWTNYFHPHVGIAAVQLLERAGYDVLCPSTVCCGRTAISQGLLAEACELAQANVTQLARLAGRGVPIVGVEPSCLLTLVDEYPQLVRTSAARRVAEQSLLLETLLSRTIDLHPEALPSSPQPRHIAYHGHCHQKALVGTQDAMALLRRAFGDGAVEIEAGCCGMAGAFGHEVEHHDLSKTVGEQRLFPAVRDHGEAEIVVSGFSCRTQIEHHTGVQPIHLAELLAQAFA
ncbi:MAG: FAD-linked oxidase C-terminal domain-containing protein [Planctomycetota bacterium]